MITTAYLSYRMSGRPERQAVYGVRARSESEAFEQAVEHLKADLICRALEREIEARPTNDIGLRAKVYEILRLRPWANGYTHSAAPDKVAEFWGSLNEEFRGRTAS